MAEGGHGLNLATPAALAALARKIMELTPAGCMVLDRDYRIQYANGYFHRQFGLEPGRATGATCFDIIHHGHPCQQCVVRKTWEDGQPHHLTLRKDVRQDGTAMYLESHTTPLKGPDGETRYVLDFYVDRTKAVMLQREAAIVFHDIVRSLVNIMEKKDPYTFDHSGHVSAICARLAAYLGLPDDLVYKVSLGGVLHDIGKLVVPDAILSKPGPLTGEEYAAIKRHPQESFRLVAGLEGFEEVKDICLHHHERWDGTGYPDGLKGEEIPLAAQIAALANVYDALTSERPYRPGMSHENALGLIRQGLGTQFAPKTGRLFLEMATGPFNSRELLTAHDAEGIDTYARYLNQEAMDTAERHVGPRDDATPRPPAAAGGFRFTDETAQALFDRAPAYFAIMDKGMNVAYISEGTAAAMGCQAADIVGRKCYEVNHKDASCLMEGEGLACPGLRAFHRGGLETGEVDEVWNGVARTMEICATPIQLEDESGHSDRYILEIVFDRTAEAALRRRLSRDCRKLVLTLHAVIDRLKPDETANFEAVVEECQAFGDFLERYDAHLEATY